MNNALKPTGTLQLDERYSIKAGSGNSVVLVLTEERYNDELELVTKTEEWYFTRVAQALRKYVDLEIIVTERIEDLTDTAEKIYKLIDRIDQTFKQF